MIRRGKARESLKNQRKSDKVRESLNRRQAP